MILSTSRVDVDALSPMLFLGAAAGRSTNELHELRARGVRACVDLREETFSPQRFDAFLWLPTPDHEPPRIDHLHLGISFLRRCHDAGLPALAVCAMGIGRSVTLVLAYYLAGEHVASEARDVLSMIAAKRPIIRPTLGQIEAAEMAARSYTPV